MMDICQIVLLHLIYTFIIYIYMCVCVRVTISLRLEFVVKTFLKRVDSPRENRVGIYNILRARV
jgi:hypothetical protein